MIIGFSSIESKPFSFCSLETIALCGVVTILILVGDAVKNLIASPDGSQAVIEQTLIF
jgi:dTDP-glucose pyrophosphorylase